MSVDALYAYAVVPEGSRLPAGAPPILPGARHVLVAGGGCAALVSPVPRAPFQPGPAGRLGDPDWLAERARAHRGAVAAAAAAGPVLPLAFGAIFAGPGALAAWLEARGARLRAALTGRDPLDRVRAEVERDLPRVLAGTLAGALEREALLLRPAIAALAEDPSLEDLRAEMARIRRDLSAPLLAARLSGV
jgi:hypothetical protein